MDSVTTPSRGARPSPPSSFPFSSPGPMTCAKKSSSSSSVAFSSLPSSVPAPPSSTASPGRGSNAKSAASSRSFLGADATLEAPEDNDFNIASLSRKAVLSAAAAPFPSRGFRASLLGARERVLTRSVGAAVGCAGAVLAVLARLLGTSSLTMDLRCVSLLANAPPIPLPLSSCPAPETVVFFRAGTGGGESARSVA